MDQSNNNINADKYVNIETAFYFNHTWMFFTVIITLLTAIIVRIPMHRYIILMETFISSVSTYIYYLLGNKIRKNRENLEDVDWKGITVLRYNGWVFTTPIMLIAFLLFLSNSTKVKLTIPIVITIVLLDWLMLLLGYLGEIGQIDRSIAFYTGFAPLLVIFGIIYQVFFTRTFIFFNAVLFALFIIFWGLYGVGYMLELEPRNYLMNILDLLSKSGFGLLFAYYFLSVHNW
jgi:hypothetical protein